MRARTDKNGKIWIRFQLAPDVAGELAINCADGAPFAPHTIVDIQDERLERVLRTVLAPLGGADIQLASVSFEERD